MLDKHNNGSHYAVPQKKASLQFIYTCGKVSFLCNSDHTHGLSAERKSLLEKMKCLSKFMSHYRITNKLLK